MADQTYELAVHTVRLQRSATLIDVQELWSVQNAVSQTALAIVQTSSPEQFRRMSMAIFNQDSECNELLKSLRYLQQLNKFKTYAKGRPLFSWGHLDSELFGRHLMNVCRHVQSIFRKEPRVIELTSPIYVMGDLHGNIGDLIYFEKVFWNLGPCLSPCNLLFLGDFVDRGAYGIEVITYLFCYKMQTPEKLWMLRGNHEIRDIQKMFTFYTCKLSIVCYVEKVMSLVSGNV
ncbi:Calcineurin-like phosphoesterase [Oryctes borbonicus]|uniref:Serine/threonine-protein phosphatase n=1 Tax=Oryctes borbonicus TaxID=1629725 RepID=A0A0T6BBR8_9SCAR|nr:Calcineurin-like phosphoesterase [Oryctes borbonicus]